MIPLRSMEINRILFDLLSYKWKPSEAPVLVLRMALVFSVHLGASLLLPFQYVMDLPPHSFYFVRLNHGIIISIQ